MHAVVPQKIEGTLSTIILKRKIKMKTIEISGSLRGTIGKKEAKRLRSEGNVPGVLYGGEAPVHFFASAKELKRVIYTPNVYLVTLNIDGTKYNAIVQDTQFHAIEDEVMHIDFLQVADNKPVKIEVPVKVQGYAEGMRKGGKMKLNLRRLKVKALPQYLPDSIPVNIDKLDLAQSVRVGELSMDNLEFLNAKSVPVVTIVVTRAAKAAANQGGKK